MSVASYHRLPKICVPNQSLDKVLLSNGTICKWSNLNIYENEKYEKNGRKNKEGTYNITLMSAANYPRLPNFLPNKS